MNVVCHIKDQMHRDYLNHLFAYEDGAFSVFRNTEVGRFICSMVKYSEFPVANRSVSDNAVYFRLPRTSDMPTLFTCFSYITPDDQCKINDFLVATFNLDYMLFYMVGIKCGLQQKVVIQNFILSRNLVSRVGETEQFKKRAYRLDEKSIKKMVNRLARRVQLQSAVIRKSMQEIQDFQFQ